MLRFSRWAAGLGIEMNHNFQSRRTRAEDVPPDIDQRMRVYDSMLAESGIGWYTDRPFLKTLGIGGQGRVLLTERKGAGRFRMPVALKFFSPVQFKSVAHYEAEMLRLTEVASICC